MERFKRYFLVTLGFALAGAIGAAFGTGTAQAIVASLVQVANPSSSPVPTLTVSDPGRIAYQAMVQATGGMIGCGANVCNLVFPTVPRGHRVVVQHISGLVQINSGYNITAEISSSNNGFASAFVAPTPTQGMAAGVAGFDQPTLLYVDASVSVTVVLTLTGPSPSFTNSEAQEVTLTGYELDCTVAACAPIATQ